MAGPRARVQVILDRDGGLPEDVATNTLHYEGDLDVVGLEYRGKWDLDAPGLVTRVETFYQAVGPYLASTLAGTGTVKVYDMQDPKPRFPRIVDTFAFTPGEQSLPSEVALCISFKGAEVSGQANSRKRGRVYLGPLNAQIAQVQGLSLIHI